MTPRMMMVMHYLFASMLTAHIYIVLWGTSDIYIILGIVWIFIYRYMFIYIYIYIINKLYIIIKINNKWCIFAYLKVKFVHNFFITQFILLIKNIYN